MIRETSRQWAILPLCSVGPTLSSISCSLPGWIDPSYQSAVQWVCYLGQSGREEEWRVSSARRLLTQQISGRVDGREGGRVASVSQSETIKILSHQNFRTSELDGRLGEERTIFVMEQNQRRTS